MTCIHCDAMREEVAELRAALGLSGSLTVRRDIAKAWGLTAGQARVVQALYDAGGRVVPRATLDHYCLTEAGAENGADSLKAHVCRIRAKLGRDAIETTYGGGYSMTDAGRTLVATSLRLAERAA